MNQQASTLRKLLSPRHGRDGLARAATIAVAGGRAGVGTSTLATNLAVALRLQGLRVALVGLARARAPRPTLEHVLAGRGGGSRARAPRAPPPRPCRRAGARPPTSCSTGRKACGSWRRAPGSSSSRT